MIGIWFVLRYAERVQRDPSTSLVYDMKEANEAPLRRRTDADERRGRPHRPAQGRSSALFGLAFAVMIYGVIPWEDLGIGLPTLWWWFPEMTASFLLFAILIGIVGGMGEGELTSTFVDGARDLLGVALIIGIARGITVVMNNGQITDTVLHWAEEALGDVGEAGFAVVMYLLFLPLSFLIPSSSGLATVAMPIMAPLADFAGADRSLVVTAYQSASGLLNLVTPTSAVVMGGLAIARVPYGKYLRFVWPLLAILAVLTIIAARRRCLPAVTASPSCDPKARSGGGSLAGPGWRGAGGDLPADGGGAGTHDLGDAEADAGGGGPEHCVGPREPGVGGVERGLGSAVLADGPVQGLEELLGDHRPQHAGDRGFQLPDPLPADLVEHPLRIHVENLTATGRASSRERRSDCDSGSRRPEVMRKIDSGPASTCRSPEPCTFGADEV